MNPDADHGAIHPAMDQLDKWMAHNPWHPRFVPYLAYVALLKLVSEIHQLVPAAYVPAYTLQCGIVAWLLWRYRKLLPELTVNFHWAAIPVGAAVAAVWIWLGLWMAQAFPTRFADQGGTPDMFETMGRGAGWVAFSMRLAGMAILVPLFEELFVRSLLLRGLSCFKTTVIGFTQIAMDIPIVGEWLMHTSVGHWADRHDPISFGRQFDRTPLGELSLFGVIASTLIFTVGHGPRDWPASIICGVAYCLLLAATRSRGLGPVCWAHGITNALLWAYTLQTGDWQFL